MEALEIRVRVRIRRLAGFLVLFGLLLTRPLLTPDDGADVIAVIGLVLYGVLLLVAVLAWWRNRALGCLVRFDAEGVTVLGHPAVPWTDIAEVREVRRRWAAMVSVAPRPGVTLAPLPSAAVFRRSERARSAWAVRWFGGPLVFGWTHLDEPIAAVLLRLERFSAGSGVVVSPAAARSRSVGSSRRR